jgi:hypothetical protein
VTDRRPTMTESEIENLKAELYRQLRDQLEREDPSPTTRFVTWFTSGEGLLVYGSVLLAVFLAPLWQLEALAAAVLGISSGIRAAYHFGRREWARAGFSYAVSVLWIGWAAATLTLGLGATP